LLDFNQTPQISPDVFAALPTLDTIVLQIEYRAYWDNQTVEVRLQSSHNVQLDWGKCKLHWELNKTSGIEQIGIIKGNIGDVPVGSARIPMPRVQTAQLIPLTVRLVDEIGYQLGNRSHNLLVLPSHAAQAQYRGGIAVMTKTNHEVAIVRQLNYSVCDSISADTRVVVTDSPDAEILSWVQNGGKMLFVSEGDDSVFWQQGRSSTSEFNWITSTSWLRPDVYPNLKIDNPLNLPFQGVMPQSNIGGLPQEDPTIQNDFLAGRISGWVQRPSIHTVQFGYGDGIIIMTTYAILESLCYGDPDPVGVIMLNDLINYLVSDSCKPNLQFRV